ncbi:MAG TPA: zf-HC2 domain-containing protein, partial [Thermoanaerobaculia bacterium]|nr:zf-HC2 domain-containing protein [Thermoanaerobaculia bacterium]
MGTLIRESATTACPRAEALAEYLEGGLPPERRQRLEEHLAECADCCTAFAAASLFLVDGAAAGGQVRPATRLPLWRDGRVAKVVVAAAAALVVGIGFHPAVSPPRHEPRAELATIGPAHASLARFTGVVWAPPLSADAARMGPRRGVTPVFAADLDGGVELLTRVIATTPRSPRLASDLGAALLGRAEASGAGEDHAAALERIDDALAATPNLSEALFNRALALEGLGLPLGARQAWRRYLEVDASSSWAAQARRQLAAIESTAPPDGASVRAELAAVAGGDERRLAELVRGFRTAARLTVQEDLLPGWARAYLGGDGPEAERQLAAARALAAEWEAQTADATLRRAVEEVDTARDGSRTQLAHAYDALGEASRRFAVYEVAATRAAAERALRYLPPPSPAVLWARVLRLASLAYQGADVADEGRRIAAAAERAGDRATQGRAAWIVGTWSIRHDDLVGAIAADAAALAAYEELGESDSVAWMHYLSGEAYSYLGSRGEAWRHYRRALAAAPR